MSAEDKNVRHQATKNDEQTKLGVSRRNVLLAGTAVAAAFAFGLGAPIETARAHQVPAAAGAGNAAMDRSGFGPAGPSILPFWLSTSGLRSNFVAAEPPGTQDRDQQLRYPGNVGIERPFTSDASPA